MTFRSLARVLNPKASRRTRLLVAGSVWAAVGVMLLKFAVIWLIGTGTTVALWLGGGGLLLGVAAWRGLFARIAQTNARRLELGPARACVFSFQRWRSWALVVMMMGMGAGLRASPLPRNWLVGLYSAMGLALLLGSAAYYIAAWRVADRAVDGP